MNGIDISYDPFLLRMLDHVEEKGGHIAIDIKIDMLQSYLRYLVRNKALEEDQMQEYQRLIKDYETELNYLNDLNKTEQLNKEREKYHSDNFWDTAFDLYYADQKTTWDQVYDDMAARMKDLGLEMTMTAGSFKSQRKRQQKNRK